MISRGLKQGAGRANIRKKEKQMDYKGLKTECWVAQPQEKRQNEWIIRGYTRGREANLRKKEKTNG